MISFRKKAQEEIVGFVVIVVVVSVVFLMFLIIVAKNDTSTEQESIEIRQFLESTMEYTTECAVSFEGAFSDVGNLLGRCYSDSDRRCVNDKTVCEVLNETLVGILDSSFNVNEEAFRKGYEFTSLFVTNGSEEEVIYIQKGNCTSTFIGGEVLTNVFSGVIETTMRICF